MLVKLHLVINVAPAACLLLQRFGGNGTKSSTSGKSMLPIKHHDVTYGLLKQ